MDAVASALKNMVEAVVDGKICAVVISRFVIR